MKLLTRYIIREHVGPLVFALSALTSLLMLQYVARQLANLAGKGLPWAAIGEFFVLSLPFTIAMTMPMAVLVATLYAFGRMAAEHEITAFKASGVRVRSLMAPVLLCAFALSIGMVWFNDQVLPAANHRLRILQQDIARTKPTVALREQAMNMITEMFFMRVARVNAETNRIYDVVIYDLSKGIERKTVYADSGVISLDPNGRDMVIQLYDGFAQEFVRGESRRLQRSFFETQTVRQKGIAQGFENSSGNDAFKGDREMTVCEMHRRYKSDAVDVERIRQEYVSNTDRLRKVSGQRITPPRARPRAEPLAALYCEQFLGRIAGLFLPKKVEAQVPAQDSLRQDAVRQDSIRQDSIRQDTVRQDSLRQDSTRRDSTRRDSVASPVPVTGQPGAGQPVPGQPVPGQPVPGTADSAQALGQFPPPINGIPVLPRGSYTPAPGLTYSQDSALRAAGVDPMTQAVQSPAADTSEAAVALGAVNATGLQLIAARESLDSLAVEIHKKFALSLACFVFVLFGPPIALRFPRGGVGVTIGVSIVVFGLYYICLMGGEALADKGQLPAYVAMWIANVVFALAGVALLWRVESTTDNSRGGGFAEWRADRKARRALARAAKAKTREPQSPVVSA
ncbi:MAG: LptF/LptG family permease [Gemmatimonadaceae bacterium]|nr:LptF/LptG family permease [Gemmatimonadaceae bacterium]